MPSCSPSQNPGWDRSFPTCLLVVSPAVGVRAVTLSQSPKSRSQCLLSTWQSVPKHHVVPLAFTCTAMTNCEHHINKHKSLSASPCSQFTEVCSSQQVRRATCCCQWCSISVSHVLGMPNLTGMLFNRELANQAAICGGPAPFSSPITPVCGHDSSGSSQSEQFGGMHFHGSLGLVSACGQVTQPQGLGGICLWVWACVKWVPEWVPAGPYCEGQNTDSHFCSLGNQKVT